jgi:hypothetical protein
MEESEDQKQERLSDEEFARTGVASFKINIDIEITEEDLLRDLVKKTEGSNIKVEKSEEN